jgi:coenzyme Q-binding protein COQ10
VTSHSLSIDLPYRPEDLFDLAADVGRYPEFIKWIRELRIISEQEEKDRVICRAQATVGFQAFTETFITDVDARRKELAIDVKLVRGPFKRLANAWRFVPIEDGTRIEFSIQFEFKNFLLQALADANKAYAIGRIIDAFSAEAARRFQNSPA